MKPMELQPIDQDTVIADIIKWKDAIVYYNNDIKPHLMSMDNWEAVSYSLPNETTVKKLKKNITYIRENESIFNEILVNYDYTVETFITDIEESIK